MSFRGCSEHRSADECGSVRPQPCPSSKVPATSIRASTWADTENVAGVFGMVKLPWPRDRVTTSIISPGGAGRYRADICGFSIHRMTPPLLLLQIRSGMLTTAPSNRRSTRPNRNRTCVTWICEGPLALRRTATAHLAGWDSYPDHFI